MDLYDHYLAQAVSDWRVWIVAGVLVVGGLFLSFRFSQERLLWDSLAEAMRGRPGWPVIAIIFLLIVALSYLGFVIL
jgi:hypothetical protein